MKGHDFVTLKVTQGTFKTLLLSKYTQQFIFIKKFLKEHSEYVLNACILLFKTKGFFKIHGSIWEVPKTLVP